MEKAQCESCFSAKTVLRCHKCGNPSCKKCSCFVDEDEFDFLSLLPEEIGGQTFCPGCFNSSISGILDEHREFLRKARAVDVYGKDQKRETWLFQRKEPVSVKDCDDREETLLRLALLSVRKGFDIMVDVDIKSEKVGKGTYKKLIWSGVAFPVAPKKRK